MVLELNKMGKMPYTLAESLFLKLREGGMDSDKAGEMVPVIMELLSPPGYVYVWEGAKRRVGGFLMPSRNDCPDKLEPVGGNDG